MWQIGGLEGDLAYCSPSNETALITTNLSLKVSRFSVISSVSKLQSSESFRIKMGKF